jgi:hypothetical protein
MNAPFRPSSTDRALRDRIEELEEEVRQLRDVLAAPEIEVSPAWKLTPNEACVYRMLAKAKGPRSEEALLAGLGYALSDATSIAGIMAALRGKLRPFGGEIARDFGEGYRLTAVPHVPEPIYPPATVLPGAEEMTAALAGAISSKPGITRLFVAIVRVLASVPGHTLKGQEIASTVYAGWRMPAKVGTVLSMTVRRGRPHLEALGWEIVSSAGHGGGYMLRKRRGAS